MYYRKNSRQVFLQKFSEENRGFSRAKGLGGSLVPDFHDVMPPRVPNGRKAGQLQIRVGKTRVLP
jgi:hypothetical protein